MEQTHRTCICGAIYSRTEHMASFEYAVCDQTMETWKTAWVPTYRLVVGPVRSPEA
jgi:hypothetical protein